MKKAILLVLSVFTIHLVSAQKVNFGVKGGFNRTSINDEERVADSKVTPRPGFNIGGLAHIHLHHNWALQPELLYSKEGSKYDDPRYSGKTDLNSINLPVLIQYMRGPGFRVQTGPQVGYIISAKHEDVNNVETDKPDIQKVVASWGFGFGYLTKSRIGFDARYYAGISNIYKKGWHEGQAARTRSGQFGIFYQFK